MKHPFPLIRANPCASDSHVAAETPPPLAIVAIHATAIRQPIDGFGVSQTYTGDTGADFFKCGAVYKDLFKDQQIDIAVYQFAK